MQQFVDLHVFIFTLISAVERYDPRSNRWTPVSPMGTRRKHLGVAVYNNMIYAVGGRDDTTELSSAERYNPQTNTWQAVVAMTSRRSGVRGLLKSCHKIQLPVYFVHLKILIKIKQDKELLYCRENYLFLFYFSILLGWFSCSEWTTYGHWRI